MQPPELDDREQLSALERSLERILTPLEEFIHKQTTSSVLLMICAVLALAIANSPWAEHYLHLLHLPLALELGHWRLELGLLHWVNDGLMTLFFLLVGLELKRELLVGELADAKRAALPIIAAVGGMVVPAAIYGAWNPDGPGAAGWGIPMATDIAFAVGALSLLGARVPKALIMFLIALAIVDDLGAVVVIALFYTQALNYQALLLAGVLTGLLVLLNGAGVRRLLPYLLIGVGLWGAMLSSGVHATLAGVVLAFTIPIRPRYNPDYFIERVGQLSRQMRQSLGQLPDIIHNDTLRAQVIALENGAGLVQAPAQRLEHRLHLIVAYLVIPVFALANGAIPLPFSEDALPTLGDPVTVGVIMGLLVGKWLGITGATWLAVRWGMAALPRELSMRHVHGIGLLGGIGFTMSIFVADLAFPGHPEMLLMAKTGILLGSLMAGAAGYCWIRFICPLPVPPAR